MPTTSADLVLRDLGDGLILRRASQSDVEALANLQVSVFHSTESPEDDTRVAGWTYDLMSDRHPTFVPADFTVVEDTKTGALVSSLNLISQKWTYDGVEFGVGRPELVCTHPDFRNRGLVRAQFEVIHSWSADRGEMLQAITGIPYYYRQFGYEMAGNLGGSRWGSWWLLPAPKQGEEDAYSVRPATEADLPFIMRMLAQADRRSLLAAVRNEERWRYELTGMCETNMQRMVICVIEATGGEPAGCLVHPFGLWRFLQGVERWELAPGVSWLAVAPSVMHYLQGVGEAQATREGKQCQGYALALGAEHPAYAALRDWLPGTNPPYTWYLRVPDLPAFLHCIAPALERRLAASSAVGHSGELKISFYRGGLRIVLEGGRLVTVERWQPTPADNGKAAFPGLTFLQLLFGHRNVDELHYAFGDCWVEGDTPRMLLETLFPKQQSHVWPIS